MPQITFRRPTVGLKNLGNTCYANAVLTCLFPLPELWEFSSSSNLHQSAKAVLTSMNTKPRDPTKATPHKPTIFLKSLATHISKARSKPFRYERQHDAAEVLGYVLEEISHVGNKRQLLATSFLKSSLCQVCGSPPQSPFNCPGELILNLNVWDSVANSLAMMLAGGVVHCHCNFCNTNQKFTEHLSFKNLPQVLIVRLQRAQFDFHSGERRVGDSVICDRQLTISTDENQDVSPAKYLLIAVIHHIGDSPSSGHYTATLINPRSKQMWKYDDESVTSEKSLDQQSAYILLYKKVNS